MMSRPLLTAVLLGGVFLLAGCTAGFVPPPIPATTVEVIPKPPVTATPIIWQPGHWDWNGNGYIWVPGQYVPNTGHGNLFMPGWWAQTSAGWQWQPAHWM